MSSVQKVVLIPRYSTYLAGGAELVHYRSAPINVRDYSRADLTLWRGLFETPAAFDYWLEESVDLLNWSSIEESEVSGTANEEFPFACELELPWVRSVVRLQNPPEADGYWGVTCWVVGNFTMRDR